MAIQKTKILKWQQDSIVKALTDHAAEKDVRARTAQEGVLAQEVYHHIFSNDEIQKMNSLPKGFLDENDRFDVNASGWSFILHFYDSSRVLAGKGQVDGLALIIRDQDKKTYQNNSLRLFRFPANKRHIRHNITDDKLNVRIKELAQWSTSRPFHSLSGEIRSVVSSYTSPTKLLAALPLIEEVMPGYFDDDKKPVSTALVPSAEKLMCKISHVRAEPREGCYSGIPVSELMATEPRS